MIAPAGSGAGQVDEPVGVAVDQSTGVLYVADANNNRIDEFARDGSFMRAFGFGVRDGTNKLEVCTAETTCQGGLHGESAGEPQPVGLAVNSATHDVYVSEPLLNRVQEFTEAGAFVTMFGKEVDKGPGHAGDVCSATFVKEGEECGRGTSTTEPGGFGDEGQTPLGLPLALDGSGNVWVGDIDRLEKFSGAGVFLEELALSAAGRLGALGLDTLGNLFIFDSAEEAIQKLDAKGTQLSTFDEAPGNPRTLVLGGAEGLYVGDEGPPYHLIRFDAASGEEQEVFGAGNVIGSPNKFHKPGPQSTQGENGNAIAFDDTTSTVYAAGCEAASTDHGALSVVTAIQVPAPGPLQRSLSTEKVRGTRAKLVAVLNAEGAETEFEFQYVDDATFKAEAKGHEWDHASATPLQKLGASFVETPVGFEVTGLASETAYHFRLTAQNSDGSVQTAEAAPASGTFETPPPVEIDAVYTTNVTTDSATLNASLNPEGASSTFHFEYLPESAYRANLEASRAPFADAARAPVPDGSLGEGETPVAVTQTISGLAAGTSYEFRVVGSNSGGVGASAGKAFGTRPLLETTLPDGREWELVSPLEKHGGLFEGIGDTGIEQAAAAGGGITYLATRPSEESPQGYLLKEQVLSERTGDGWVSRDLSLPHETATGENIGVGEEYRFFSEDLSKGIVQPFGLFDPAVSEEASEETPLLRTTAAGGGYQPLVIGCPPPGQECRAAVESHADVPPGTRFGIAAGTLEPCTTGVGICGVQFVGASSDAQHVILESPVVGLTAVAGDNGGLYEWSEGHLALVSVLPSNAPASFSDFTKVPTLGRNNTSAVGAVSSDGTRVDWTFKGHLYQRNLTTGKTIQIDTPGTGAGGQPSGTEAEFQSASPDGKVILFTDEQKLFKEASPAPGKPDLYRCAIVEGPGAPKCELSDLLPGIDLQGALLGSSTDESYVYFVANGVAAGGAEPGGCENQTDFKPEVECNLYEWHEGTVTLVAQLAGEDEPDWRRETSRRTARVSPNGQWLEFMSKRPLTGYENTDVHSGEADEEVFLFNAGTDKLACVSCNPSGQRPSGAEYGGQANLSSGDRIWQPTTWLAANVPGWTSYKSGLARYQPRYLSDEGRLFFDSHDGLTTTDTNATEDVYEFEPSGVGGCESTSAAFVVVDGGCVSLISSGTSRTESAFLDASESGNDVFFLTAAPLAHQDEDEAVDVYDAHVCASSDPCVVPPPAAIEHCTGEACQPRGAVPTEPTIGSLLDSGLGNLTPAPATVPKPKVTPSQRYKNALKVCRRKHSRKARRQCEAKARRTYRAAVKHAKRARRHS